VDKECELVLHKKTMLPAPSTTTTSGIPSSERRGGVPGTVPVPGNVNKTFKSRKKLIKERKATNVVF